MVGFFLPNAVSRFCTVCTASTEARFNFSISSARANASGTVIPSSVAKASTRSRVVFPTPRGGQLTIRNSDTSSFGFWISFR